MELLGNTITHYLQLRDMTRAELARRTGISSGQLSDICNNRVNITVETLQRIADGLGVQPADLLQTKKQKISGHDYESLLTPEQKEYMNTNNLTVWEIVGKSFEDQGLTPEKVKKYVELAMRLESQFKNDTK